MRYQRSATNAFLALGLSAIFPIATSASSPSSVGNRNLKNVFNNNGSGGSTGGPPGQGQKETNSLECTLLLSQDLPIHASENEISNSSTSTSSEDDNDSDTSIVCIMDPADTDGIPGMMRTIEGTAEQIEEIKSKFARGEMRSGEAKLVHGKGVGFDKKSMFLPKELAIKDSVKQSNEHSRKQGDGTRTRRLANTLGDKPILAVRVIDSTGLAHSDNASTMSSNIFGTNGNDPVNLKSQLSACSFDQLTVVPGLTGTVEGNDKNEEALGVVEVTIPLDITSTTDDVLSRLDVLNAVTTAVQAKLGFELPGPYEHLMYILEGCYGDDCGWAAYAYINSVLSVYQGDYYQMAGVQLHELGHNLNLAHSGGVNSLPYSDHTCLMGNPLYSDDVGKMCFNPAKNWQLNWYGNNNGKKLIDPTDINWQHEEVTMVGIAEYNLKSADQPVTIKLETGSSSGNYFIGFNRKTGANSESVDGGDSVTITRVSTGNGEDYSQSYLMAVIAQGEEYTIADVAAWDTPLTIKVDTIDIDTTGTTDPGIAVICVTKTGNCNGNGNSSPKSPNKPPTPNSTPPPTSSQNNNPTLVSNACDAVVPNVLLPQDTVETFGCITETTPGNAYDGNTNSFECEKDPAENKRKHGLIISNVADRLSIVEKLRVYASADCEGCDPVKFKVEGRGGLNCMRINNIDVAELEAFKLIKKGDLLWIDDAPGITRNAAGEDIVSTYAAGDPNKSYTEIDLENSSTEGPAECRDYRITFTYTRLDTAATPIRVGEVELVGRITSACPTVPPNQAPPTGTPTSSPTVSNKPSTSLVPSVAPTVTTAPSCGRDEVATVFLPGDTVETSGCTSVSSPGNAYDGTTNEFQCVKDPAVAADTRKHEIIISNDGRTSIVEKLRVYANSDCQECDAVTYKVEGRGGPNCNRINNIELEGIAEMEAFKLIKKGDLPWANATGTIGRNAVGEDIVSTYAEGGVGKSYTEVSLDNFGTEGPAECRDYRITFKYTRLDTAATPIEVGEIELVGKITNACVTPSPTPACSDNIIRRNCRRVTGCSWKNKQCIVG